MDTHVEDRMTGQQWEVWRVPVALGVGLLGVGGFFVLLAHGLAILSSIDY